MTNDQMTTNDHLFNFHFSLFNFHLPTLYDFLRFAIVPLVHLIYQALVAPVLEHHAHLVGGHRGTLHGNGLLHGLLEGEGVVQAAEDGVVLAKAHAIVACIVTRLESTLDAVAEEVERTVEQRVGYHVKRI